MQITKKRVSTTGNKFGTGILSGEEIMRITLLLLIYARKKCAITGSNRKM